VISYSESDRLDPGSPALSHAPSPKGDILTRNRIIAQMFGLVAQGIPLFFYGS
jgi:hypothetical protein